MAPSQRLSKRRSRSRDGTVQPNRCAAKQLPLPPPFAPGESASAPPRVLTIGHSNHPAGRFLDLLRQHDVQTLIDVRSAPYSRYAPHFGREILADLLDRARIAYLWHGDALGGRPDDPACYHRGVVKPGNVDYAALAQQPWYQAGLDRLMAEAAKRKVAIMCSEEDPRRCHRHRLIEPSLRGLGADVEHIRGDGRLETIPPDDPQPADIPNPQLSLAGFAA